MRWWSGMLLGVLIAGTFALTWWLRGQVIRTPTPDGPAVVEKVREVARLEALDVMLSKVVSYEPDPEPSDSIVGAVATWAKFSVSPPEGRAMVFGIAHLGLDVSKLDASRVVVRGDSVEIDLPPVRTSLELLPDRTEVVRSNLDSQQTAELLAKAKRALEADVTLDRGLQIRARTAAEGAITNLLKTMGFREVRFGPPGNA